ncbi:NAD-dependent epimerase/dehydratase family protein [Aureimonas sp. Leaf454]|uniref:NAD-dependent epimerase/dehydratase family protein n=1 Tax=Aureimonas sp. Leaf454 TaxID=1736381 RepID=UPI000B2DFE05|nr:NAD-dependent epimerase/dehydratase family protein [Aureimonas sp. Leaf454]
MRILVTGASGFVGRHLVASLRGEDKSVMVLSRGGGEGSDATTVVGPADLADIAAGPPWPTGIDAVVHLAAVNPGRGGPVDGDAMRRANVDGTAALARKAVSEGVRRMIFVSTANVHGAGPSTVREADDLHPGSAYARSKAEAERAFRRTLEGTGMQGCILRPAPVFGQGGRGNVASLARLARLPVPLPIAGLGGRRSLVSIDTLVEVIGLCLRSDGADGQTFLVADDGPVTPAEIVRALRRGWRRREGVFTLPAGLRSPLSKALADRGPMADFALDTGHLVRCTGWRPGPGSERRLEDMAAAGRL